MECQGFEECAECSRLLFPGDEYFSVKEKVICSVCHALNSITFAGVVLCRF